MAKQTIKISSLVGQGAVCNGDFSCPGSARIDGTVNGSVEVGGMLVLGTAGCINGDVYADAVVIGGEVNGNITASTKAAFTETSKVIGDVVTGIIVIDENAIFQGSVTMNQVERKQGFAYKKGIRSGKRNARQVADEAMQEVEEVPFPADF